ncbi:tRNA (guanine-N1)-methyltransferase [Plebeiibacterium sediminum]|uniref:tRNA (Guanine-N1)-methyltransferase n=1 Tax=Plebeiibacterium sediminum TaxID=2992112 RepID=A0AAE3M223_9BACT|nr:tRNA (guanine-N1)-methyltransferase [Plebeiobacterium sediminum]MCW3785659.1 tRNA (guanine-N1)-methyltransferase [Plebeiobacterium sediminum]
MKTTIFRALFLSTIFLFSAITISAQNETEENKSGLDEGTLESQFNYIIKKSESYEAYQVVKRTWLHKIKDNALDSVKVLKESITKLETESENQKSEINSLKADLKETNEKLTLISKQKDSFAFLGILMGKGTYNVIVWSLVFVFAAAFVIMFLLFKRSHAVTAKTKQDLIDKQEEFDAHRKWALEREQTLARDLNKLKQKYKGLD